MGDDEVRLLLDRHDGQFDTPGVGADPNEGEVAGLRVRLFHNRSRGHDVEGMRLADPVLPCRLAEPDRLDHNLIMQGTNIKCKAQIRQQSDGRDAAQ